MGFNKPKSSSGTAKDFDLNHLFAYLRVKIRNIIDQQETCFGLDYSNRHSPCHSCGGLYFFEVARKEELFSTTGTLATQERETPGEGRR